MPPQKKSAKKSASYHHGDLRRELLDHAARLLDSRGAEELSLRDLAKQARVSPAAPYRHFESKEALLAALAEQAFEELETKLLKATDQNPADPREQLLALARAYIDLAARRPHLFRMMFSAVLGPSRIDEGIFRPCDRVYVAMVNSFAFGQKSEWLKEADPNHQALAFWSLLHGFGTLLADRRLDDLKLDAKGRAALLDRFLESLFTGLER